MKKRRRREEVRVFTTEHAEHAEGGEKRKMIEEVGRFLGEAAFSP